MTNSSTELGVVQRWMQTVLMHPGGVEEAIASVDARQWIDVPPENAETVILPSETLSGLERLAIYHRAYFARLLECLRDTYRVLFQAIGEEAFDDFAINYLLAHPSRSYTLNDLGAKFPEYLRQSRLEAGPHETWPDFVVDLATLECLYNEIFDGPGTENQPLITAESLASIPPERWVDVRMIPVPCLRLIELRFPVHEYYSAIRHGRDAEYPEPSATLLAVLRRDYTVRRYELSRPQFELLGAILRGETIGAALSVAAEVATDVDQFAIDLEEWFRNWTGAGFFLDVAIEGSPQREEWTSSPAGNNGAV